MPAIPVYHFKSEIIVPTMGSTESGISRLIEPVQVLPNPNLEELLEALEIAAEMGNPRVERSSKPSAKPVLLRFSKARTLRQFEEGALAWEVDLRPTSAIVTPSVRHPEGGFVEVPAKAVTFHGPNLLSQAAEHILRGTGWTGARDVHWGPLRSLS